MNEDNLQGQAQLVFTLFSIGHSNHPLEKFFELLEAYEIEVLVDVRSQPYSKYSSHFNSAELKQAVKDHHLKYLFMGQELGGRPKGEQFYDAAGRVNYGLVAASPLFLEGVERLLNGIERYRVAIMCSEEEPRGCHRHLLVSRVLAERGVNVVHIRGDGSAQTENEINQPPAGETDHIQLSLFAAEEVTEWKSIRSVLPKKTPPNFSESSEKMG
jgi:uncharacterized protein (DUF488 family)